ncbi:hypothetical protein Rsub_03976 [Raphidocelis subcapitata]|uniref:Programmed cell death protein 2 C-terminal domain-containing protein n=1 Tax=Raphidocelis subcapitata TaxID=307507 RepID=A0A2V0NYB5_9CHLO|nr:hypothetical protein Rsub_03976 [Raphidocelis subcapitata]|eukprot:GBF91672.1 hypothetical protein Rsub_03976 [Raphidocelis subcapitata]
MAAAAHAAAQSQTVWLGLAGDLVGAEEQLDYHATKCGGAPRYPGRQPPLAPGDVRCGVCGKPLSLVLQAYSPTADAEDRCLLVFGCTAQRCGRQPGSWRAWRCQLPPARRAPAAAAAAAAAKPVPESPAVTGTAKRPEAAAGGVPGFDAGAGDDWGLGGGGSGSTFGAAGTGGADDDWGFGSGGSGGGGGTFALGAEGGTGGGAFDFSDLTSAVEAAATGLSAAPKQKAVPPKAADDAAAPGRSGAAAAAPSCAGEAGPRLPEFQVYAEEEPPEASVPERELRHARELLARYQAEAEAGGGAPAAAPAGAAPSGSGRHKAAAGGGGGGGGARDEGEGPESWAGEGYEPTEMRGVVRSYVKFSKRVARQPLQCARYCPGASPLWPHPTPPRPAACASCGAPRAFELQLMPALIQMVVEAGEMEKADGGGGGGGGSGAGGAGGAEGKQAEDPVLSAVSQWDWCTAAVFTCTASCGGSGESKGVGSSSGGGGSGGEVCFAVEEQVALVNESELHTLQTGGGTAGAAAAAAAAGIVL